MAAASSAHCAILRQVAKRLATHGSLSEADLAAIEHLPGEPATHRRGADITPAADSDPQFIIAGWACEMRPLSAGKRQIFRFMLPGDILGSFWPRLQVSGCQTLALTRLEMLPAGALMAIDGAGGLMHGAIVDAGRRAEDRAQGLLLDHIVRLGSRDAYCGLSHLLLELHERLARMKLTHEGGFPLPIGQRVLAQAMGFSLTHLNHTLQRMEADGLIEAKGHAIRLLQPDRMATVSDFAGSEWR